MGNGCCGCSKKPSSPDAASASNNLGDKELESMLDNIKAEMDARNVDPKEVINRLNSLLSQIKENKKPQSMESSTGGFYSMVDKIAVKWEKLAKTEIPEELAKIMASILKKVGVSDYILVGLSVIGSILSRALKTYQNKKSCIEFIGNLSCLLAILDSNLSNNVSVSASALQSLASEIMKSISACCKYASLAFGNQMLNANALEVELKEAYLQLYRKVQDLQLDAQFKALYEIDKINRKLDHMLVTYANVAEEELDENAVGIKKRVRDVEKFLLLENKDVKGAAVILHGQGGMGKSTLARSVKSSAKPHASHGFKFASVIFDTQKSESDLETHKKELQSKILYQLSGNNIKVDDITAGQRELRKVLSSGHCFVFIDNVVRCGQLSDFFPANLASDDNHSLRILVTSRDLDARAHLPLQHKDVKVYDVNRLDDDSSLVALKKYMDVAESTQEEFTGEFDNIERIAKLCYGTPILLSTVGRDLKCKRSKRHYYNDVIRRLEEADFSDYNERKLEDFILSVFNLLGAEIKAAFLDICKLLYRWKWELVRDIVGDTAMDELSDRLMIRKDQYVEGDGIFRQSIVTVHDLLHAMALRLVKNEKKRLVINLDDDGTGCLELSKLVGTETEGLFISNKGSSLKSIYVKPEVFQGLRLLQLNGVRLEFRNEDVEYIPDKLEYLGIHNSHLGGEFQISHWLKAEKPLPHLRTLALTECNDEFLDEFLGNVEKLVKLECLWLMSCRHLRELPSGILRLPRLRKLMLTRCEQLQCLPEDIGELCNLTHLVMDHCDSLKEIPKNLAKLGSLEMLSLRGCTKLVALPAEVGKLPCLKKLRLDGCSDLETLPSRVAGLKALEKMDINHCQELRRLPVDIGELSSLKKLYMNNCCLERLPSSLAKLSSLQCLTMNGWSDMVTVPDFILDLYSNSLKDLSLSGCYKLKKLPTCLEGFSNMEVLRLRDCKALEVLPDLGNMHSLRVIDLAGCSKLQIIPPGIVELKDLEFLDIRNCTSIQNAGGFIQNMLQAFRNSEDPRGFRYDGDWRDKEGIIEA